MEMPLGYTTSEERPSGSSQTRCDRPGNLWYLESREGQYRGATPFPPAARNMGDRWPLRSTTARVSSVVLVFQTLIRWSCIGFWCRKLKGTGSSSPRSTSNPSKSRLESASLGGVPVFNLPIWNPIRFNVSASTVAGASPARPAGICVVPTWMMPRRKVPVVTTTLSVATLHLPPSASLASSTPDTAPKASTRTSSTLPQAMRRLGVCVISSRIAALYRSLSICALGPWTAGPLERFSIRNCMPPWSAMRPISPPMASISRTRCPFPIPPIDGLHDIVPKSASF
mmetsp:Transcript_14914/g.35107  ORF Transcript_14914/g.35107 Transcript_14914/m.35107 type:complete len:284 (+) Transcript_14914:1059-1910(+)